MAPQRYIRKLRLFDSVLDPFIAAHALIRVKGSGQSVFSRANALIEGGLTFFYEENLLTLWLHNGM
jgi:hypothetical protein